ncbi:unnamed protein product [Mytilus coruscus]|uniref:CHRNN n=1 Tax=Mytilus coruscus TaxID=42192 RepID=A0A6J8BNE9_MYTCO|nr:unnamed protein product [Mytilus coruscus]
MYMDTPVSCIFLFGILSSGNSQTLSDMKQLYSDIFANHQKSLIPNSDFSSPLEVKLQFHLMTITQFREVEETLQIAGGISAFWTDGEFAWTPSSYGNAEYIIVPHTIVWTPRLVLLNSVGTLQPLGLGNELSVTIDYNGSTTVSFGEVLSSKCSTDIYKFPFDSQTCELEFAAWGVYARDIRLLAVSNPIDLSFFTPNSDWDLVSNNVTHPSTGYSIFKIELTLKRSSLYYTVIVICPFILFSILNPLVFLLPVEAGERIGLALTVLLSYTIFLSMVQTSIPAASNPMSLLLIIMIATILLSGIIAIVTIYITSLYYREESTKMNFLLKFIGQKWQRCNKITQVMPLCNDGFGHDLANRLVDDGFIVFAGVLNFNGKGACELRNRNLRNLNVVQLNLTKADEIDKAVAIVSEQCSAKGRIVNVSSVRGRFPWPGYSTYHVSKARMETMSDSLRLEMVKFGIKVAVVEPGWFPLATAAISIETCERVKKDCEEQWKETSEEIKRLYGRKYFNAWYDEMLVNRKDTRAASSSEPVIDAMVDALRNVHPKYRYLVDGGQGFNIDTRARLAACYNFLPDYISDPYIMWNSGYKYKQLGE